MADAGWDPALDERVAALGLELPHLARAAALTTERTDAARKALRAYLGPAEDRRADGIDIVVAGSVARQEMSDGSDFDYFLLAEKLVGHVGLIEEYRLAADHARAEIGAGAPAPTGIFGGRMIPASDFVDLIGLEEDSNRNQTRRVLFLEESRSLWQPECHALVRRRVLERYLYDYLSWGKQGVPRFLLNDVVRYWRTVAVDYQAKRWREVADARKKWGLRYLKLRISRKLTFAGSLVAVVWPTLQGEPTTVDALADQFGLVALGRLAQLGAVLDGEPREALLETFRIADEFAGALEQTAFREEAHATERPDTAPADSTYLRMRSRADELQECLERVFFCDSELGVVSRRYLIF